MPGPAVRNPWTGQLPRNTWTCQAQQSGILGQDSYQGILEHARPSSQESLDRTVTKEYLNMPGPAVRNPWTGQLPRNTWTCQAQQSGILGQDSNQGILEHARPSSQESLDRTVTKEYLNMPGPAVRNPWTGQLPRNTWTCQAQQSGILGQDSYQGILEHARPSSQESLDRTVTKEYLNMPGPAVRNPWTGQLPRNTWTCQAQQSGILGQDSYQGILEHARPSSQESLDRTVTKEYLNMPGPAVRNPWTGQLPRNTWTCQAQQSGILGQDSNQGILEHARPSSQESLDRTVTKECLNMPGPAVRNPWTGQ